MILTAARSVISAALVCAAASVLAPPAGAAAGENVIVVTTTKDANRDDDGRCSLREALNASSTDVGSGVAPGECPGGDVNDIVKLKPGATYTLTSVFDFAGDPTPGVSEWDEDDGGGGDLDIYAINPGAVRIVGGRGTVVEQRVRGQRVIETNPGVDLTLERVTIAGGRAGSPEHPSGDPSLHGGGIFSRGKLTLQRAAIVGNTAGDAPMTVPAITLGGSGGGIYHTGTAPLSIHNSRIASNRAGRGMPAIGGPAPSAQSGGYGGGVYHASGGPMTVDQTTIANNRAGDGGPGAIGSGPFPPKVGGPGGSGGGIATESNILHLAVSTIAGNSAGNGGRGGDGGTGPSGEGQDGAEGGAAGGGGGIFVSLSSDASIGYSTISGNRTGRSGPGGDGGPGTPIGDPGVEGAGDGGGGLLLDSDTVLENVTVSGNTATGSGGGVATSDVLRMNNVTIARNRADGEGGGLAGGAVSVTEIDNTLIGDNRGGLGDDCSETFIANSNNLIEDTLGCDGLGGTDTTGVDPKLGKLDSNGGPTKTHALLRASPAIDNGNPGPPDGTEPSCAVVDQRGKPRTVCDIGAFER